MNDVSDDMNGAAEETRLKFAEARDVAEERTILRDEIQRIGAAIGKQNNHSLDTAQEIVREANRVKARKAGIPPQLLDNPLNTAQWLIDHQIEPIRKVEDAVAIVAEDLQAHIEARDVHSS